MKILVTLIIWSLSGLVLFKLPMTLVGKFLVLLASRNAVFQGGMTSLRIFILPPEKLLKHGRMVAPSNWSFSLSYEAISGGV